MSLVLKDYLIDICVTTKQIINWIKCELSHLLGKLCYTGKTMYKTLLKVFESRRYGKI